MIITIKNDDGESVFDVSKIEDEQRKANANISITKIGTLNTIVEALNYASQGHQNNLEAVLKESPEAIVEQDDEEETSTEEESLNEVS
jgi:ribonuclease PH